MTLKLGSLFDGSGGFPLAGCIHGVTPVWASEIEPYPVRVTTARFPGMKHLGDVTKIDGAAIEPVDIITFGSPCQDLSVAGLRSGIHTEGGRSNLFFEAIRIIKEMRESTDGIYPRIAVWENVPGAFSSNKGADFQAVLQAFVSIGDQAADVPMPQRGKWAAAGCVVGTGFSVAWRTLDAQYNGVPQRRRRIYLIADFGSERAGEILFEQEGLRGDSAESGTAGQGAAGDTAGSVRGGCEPVNIWNAAGYGDGKIAKPITGDHENRTSDFSNVLVQRTAGEGAADNAEGSVGGGVWPVISGSLCARADSSPCVDRGQPFIVFKERAGCPGGGKGILCGDKPFTLSTLTDQAVCYAVDGYNQSTSETAGTIRAGKSDQDHVGAICYPKAVAYSVDCRNMNLTKDHGTLQAKENGGQSLNYMGAVLHPSKPPRRYIIRRLTPLECCRLQGFTDWWEDGVQGSDSARYKMWGNGICFQNAAYVVGCAVRLLAETAHKTGQEGI